MCAIGMVIGDVVFDKTTQVSLVEDQYVILKIPATASDPAFRSFILPGTRRAYARGFQATRRQEIDHLVAEFTVTIENRIAVRTRFRQCLPQLLH